MIDANNKIAQAQPGALVRWWHRIFGCPIGTETLESCGDRRWDFINEEVLELAEALDKGDRVAALDALADIVFTSYGMAVELGWDLDEALRRVYLSNMTKLFPPDNTPRRSPGGKVLKGPNYTPPVLADLIVEAPNRRPNT